jgi:hypothetical protein
MIAMKFARITPFLMLSALALAACGKDDSAESPAATAAAGNSLLELVPADTPYLGGNLAPIPDELLDSYLKRAEPMLASLQASLTELKQDLANDAAAQSADDEGARIARAIVDELDGKLNRAGLESLGFDLSPEQVVYGMSVFPVMRTSLSDATALRATVQRVLDKAAVEATSLEFQGKPYWRFIPDMHEHEEHGGETVDDVDAGVEDNVATEGEVTVEVDIDLGSDSGPATEEEAIGIYIAILDDHMAIGILPVFAEASVLPAFLALEKPADSAAADTLEEINDRFGFSPYGSGVMEFQKLMDEMADGESLAGQFAKRAGHEFEGLDSEVCRQELQGIIAHTPRAYSGISELSEAAVGNRVVLETESSLAGELAALVADVPVVNPKSTYLAELALGLKVGPVRDFLRAKADAIVAQPYQCEKLAELNDRAREASGQLNQPIPPLVNNLFGLRAAISSMEGSSPESAKGLLALHVTQPEMLVGMAQMLVPGLAEMNLAPGAAPVRIPSDMMPLPDLVVYAMQGNTSLGLSVGEGEQDKLPGYIGQEGKADGTFLSVNYDAAAYMDMTGSIDMGDDYEAGEEMAGDLAGQIYEEYRKLVDRNDTRLSFSKDGFVMDSTTTLKNP